MYIKLYIKSIDKIFSPDSKQIGKHYYRITRNKFLAAIVGPRTCIQLMSVFHTAAYHFKETNTNCKVYVTTIEKQNFMLKLLWVLSLPDDI